MKCDSENDLLIDVNASTLLILKKQEMKIIKYSSETKIYIDVGKLKIPDYKFSKIHACFSPSVLDKKS